MSFDRHEILKRHYAEQIAEWDWDNIVADAKANVEDDYEGNHIGSCFLGTVFHLMPSGKFYTLWTTNQTRSDETRDSAFMEALEERAQDAGGSVENGEGDSCDMFFTVLVKENETSNIDK